MYRYIVTIVINLFFLSSVSYAIPSEYTLKSQGIGWKIFQKGDNSNKIFIQEVDLKKAKIVFLDKEQNSNGEFEKFQILDLWKSISNLSYSLSNGAFFEKTENKFNGLSFPYKVNGVIKTNGWVTSNHNDNDLKILYFYFNNLTKQDEVTIAPYKDYLLNNKNAKNALVGFDPEYSKKEYMSIGRTFIGMKDKTTVYILNGKSLTQYDAVSELINFNVANSNIVMFDGSGSTQLYYKKSNGYDYIYGCTISSYICNEDKRDIPQAIAVMKK